MENNTQFQMPATRSEKIGTLATKLSKAQMEFDSASHDKNNPFFKSGYTSRAKLITSVNKALSKHGIAYIEEIIHVPNKMPVFRGMIICETKDGEEQFIASDLDTGMFGHKKNVQEMGSTLTYLSRYVMKHLLCIPDGCDETDDDGESTVRKENTPLDPQQVKELNKALSGKEDLKQKIYDAYNVKDIKHIPKHKYNTLINRINELSKSNTDDK